MAEQSNSTNIGWRIPKACEECRKRKIRCDGTNPCRVCHVRKSPCVYRDVIRHRKKKHEYQASRRKEDTLSRAPAIEMTDPKETRQFPLVFPNSAAKLKKPIMLDLPKSVSATQKTSPMCQVQLYYGPSSHFALMQHIYSELVTKPRSQSIHPTEVEEAGAGLDMFCFRRIFFGTSSTNTSSYRAVDKLTGSECLSEAFLPQNLANLFLSRFLSTFYHMMPFFPEVHFEQYFEQLYSSSPVTSLDAFTQAMVFLSLAIGSLGTELFAWGDVLYACFQNEQGRPNSTFLHLGSAVRKALSTGLHKHAPNNDTGSPEDEEERRITFWSLYFHETWYCFHQGRPCSLASKDFAIDCPQNPFIQMLASLCKTVARSRDEVYDQPHDSLLDMLKIATSIAAEMREHAKSFQSKLGFSLDLRVQQGSIGFKQIICSTLYYHTLLLTFRPFLIFRGHWKRQIQLSPDYSSRCRDFDAHAPLWLNEACNYALNAAQKTIHQLYEASRADDLAKQLRYNGYLISSSTFTLVYDLLHDSNVANVQLPWVLAALKILSAMRAGDPISSIISAIQNILIKINPSYERYVHPERMGGQCVESEAPNPVRTYAGWECPPSMFDAQDLSQNAVPGPMNTFPAMEGVEPELLGPRICDPGDFYRNSLDFAQSDLNQNLDFSSMNLQAFFSVYPEYTVQ